MASYSVHFGLITGLSRMQPDELLPGGAGLLGAPLKGARRPGAPLGSVTEVGFLPGHSPDCGDDGAPHPPRPGAASVSASGRLEWKKVGTSDPQ